jgi:enediyne biosynthesis protein E4
MKSCGALIDARNSRGRQRRAAARCRWSALVGALVAIGCALQAAASEPALIRLADATNQSGIRFRHTDGSSGEHYLMEAVAGALATFDYDNDGHIDIYFLNGAPLRGTPVTEPLPTNALYRNLGNWQFRDVTAHSGLGEMGFSLGVAVADYNGDGFQDVLLTHFGPIALYRNNGDGTFQDVTQQAGLPREDLVGAGACFLDIEGDGDLDLYVANYIQFSYESFTPTIFRGLKVYPGPLMYAPERDQLFRNDGDGTFTDISRDSGIAAPAQYGMGVVAADFDEDGDTDIFVANDTAPNFLWINDGQGNFKDEGLVRGVAYDYRGEVQGSMGTDVGDFNGDGRLDIFQTAYHRQLATLYQNTGRGFFQDATVPKGAGAGTYQRVNWGTGLVDFDNDGDRDLFIANGHIHDNLDEFDDNTSYRQLNQVLENRGGRFVDVSIQCGDGLKPLYSSRGACFEDFDNDGRVDAVVINSRELPTLLQNRTEGDQYWLQVELIGRGANRDGVGARVSVTAADDRTQTAEVHSGRGYQSHFGSRLHFGLGTQQRVQRIEVQWIGGNRDVVRDPPANQLLQIREGGQVFTTRK